MSLKEAFRMTFGSSNTTGKMVGVPGFSFFGMGSTEGTIANSKTAFTLSAFYNGVEQLSNDIAKLPKSVLNIITGMPDAVGAAFLESKKVKKLSFTGSTKVGQYLMRESAAHLKKLSLELGGNAPFIVFEDAESGVEAALNGGFYAVGIGSPENLGHAHLVIPNFIGQNFDTISEKVLSAKQAAS